MDAHAQAPPERSVDRTALSLPFSRAKHISACLQKAIVNRAAPRAEGEEAARWTGARGGIHGEAIAGCLTRRTTPIESAPSCSLHLATTERGKTHHVYAPLLFAL
jgi:hypothetical protein